MWRHLLPANSDALNSGPTYKFPSERATSCFLYTEHWAPQTVEDFFSAFTDRAFVAPHRPGQPSPSTLFLVARPAESDTFRVYAQFEVVDAGTQLSLSIAQMQDRNLPFPNDSVVRCATFAPTADAARALFVRTSGNDTRVVGSFVATDRFWRIPSAMRFAVHSVNVNERSAPVSHLPVPDTDAMGTPGVTSAPVTFDDVCPCPGYEDCDEFDFFTLLDDSGNTRHFAVKANVHQAELHFSKRVAYCRTTTDAMEICALFAPYSRWPACVGELRDLAPFSDAASLRVWVPMRSQLLKALRDEQGATFLLQRGEQQTDGLNVVIALLEHLEALSRIQQEMHTREPLRGAVHLKDEYETCATVHIGEHEVMATTNPHGVQDIASPLPSDKHVRTLGWYYVYGTNSPGPYYFQNVQRDILCVQPLSSRIEAFARPATATPSQYSELFWLFLQTVVNRDIADERLCSPCFDSGDSATASWWLRIFEGHAHDGCAYPTYDQNSVNRAHGVPDLLPLTFFNSGEVIPSLHIDEAAAVRSLCAEQDRMTRLHLPIDIATAVNAHRVMCQGMCLNQLAAYDKVKMRTYADDAVRDLASMDSAALAFLTHPDAAFNTALLDVPTPDRRARDLRNLLYSCYVDPSTVRIGEMLVFIAEGTALWPPVLVERISCRVPGDETSVSTLICAYVPNESHRFEPTAVPLHYVKIPAWTYMYFAGTTPETVRFLKEHTFVFERRTLDEPDAYPSPTWVDEDEMPFDYDPSGVRGNLAENEVLNVLNSGLLATPYDSLPPTVSLTAKQVVYLKSRQLENLYMAIPDLQVAKTWVRRQPPLPLDHQRVEYIRIAPPRNLKTKLVGFNWEESYKCTLTNEEYGMFALEVPLVDLRTFSPTRQNRLKLPIYFFIHRGFSYESKIPTYKAYIIPDVSASHHAQRVSRCFLSRMLHRRMHTEKCVVKYTGERSPFRFLQLQPRSGATITNHPVEYVMGQTTFLPWNGRAQAFDNLCPFNVPIVGSVFWNVPDALERVDGEYAIPVENGADCTKHPSGALLCLYRESDNKTVFFRNATVDHVIVTALALAAVPEPSWRGNDLTFLSQPLYANVSAWLPSLLDCASIDEVHGYSFNKNEFMKDHEGVLVTLTSQQRKLGTAIVLYLNDDMAALRDLRYQDNDAASNIQRMYELVFSMVTTDPNEFDGVEYDTTLFRLTGHRGLSGSVSATDVIRGVCRQLCEQKQDICVFRPQTLPYYDTHSPTTPFFRVPFRRLLDAQCPNDAESVRQVDVSCGQSIHVGAGRCRDATGTAGTELCSGTRFASERDNTPFDKLIFYKRGDDANGHEQLRCLTLSDTTPCSVVLMSDGGIALFRDDEPQSSRAAFTLTADETKFEYDYVTSNVYVFALPTRRSVVPRRPATSRTEIPKSNKKFCKDVWQLF